MDWIDALRAVEAGEIVIGQTAVEPAAPAWYYDGPDPLGCGHLPTAGERSVWWIVAPGEHLGGTGCFDCAVLVEGFGGWSVSLIPTTEQMLDWLGCELAGIGVD